MNLLVLVVLLALAWYSFEAGLTFFAFLVFLAVVLMVFTQKQEAQHASVVYAAPQAAAGQQVVVEAPEASATGEVRLKVKKWKDRWEGHPNEYLFLHAGYALQNIFRSVLYIFGIEKDKKS